MFSDSLHTCTRRCSCGPRATGCRVCYTYRFPESERLHELRSVDSSVRLAKSQCCFAPTHLGHGLWSLVTVGVPFVVLQVITPTRSGAGGGIHSNHTVFTQPFGASTSPNCDCPIVNARALYLVHLPHSITPQLWTMLGTRVTGAALPALSWQPFSLVCMCVCVLQIHNVTWAAPSRN